MQEFHNISVVVAGSWNMKIFTPNWVIIHLFQLRGDEEIEVGIDKNELRPIYKFKNILFLPSDNLAEFKIEGFITENDLQNISELALRLIKLLPFTPKLMAGLNFRKRSDKVIFNFEAINFTMDFTPVEFKAFKQLEDCILNLIIQRIDEKSQLITYNFHYSNIEKVTQSSFLEKAKKIQEYE